MKALLVAAGLACAAAQPARADSSTIYVSGTCTGQDAPAPTQIIPFGTSGIAGPVYIRAVQARVMLMNTSNAFDNGSYLFAGDGDQPDVMAWGHNLGGMMEVDWQEPGGMSFKFSRGHIDLHVSCPAQDGAWQGFYTVFWTNQP